MPSYWKCRTKSDITATEHALQVQIDTKPTFAEKTKHNAAVPAQAAIKTGLVDRPVKRDLSKIQIVSKTNTYESSAAIKKNFAEHFHQATNYCV